VIGFMLVIVSVGEKPTSSFLQIAHGEEQRLCKD
jgi:hypothetical protein